MVFRWLRNRIRAEIEPDIERRLRKEIKENYDQRIVQEKEALEREYTTHKDKLLTDSQLQVKNLEEKLRKELDNYRSWLQIEAKRKELLVDEKKAQLQNEFESRARDLQEQNIKHIDTENARLGTEYEKKFEDKKSELQKDYDAKAVELKKIFDVDYRKLEQDYGTKYAELKKTLRIEVEKEYKIELTKQIRANAEAELSKIYGEQLKQVRRIPDLEKQVRDSNEKMVNMTEMVLKVRNALSSLYQQARDAEATARHDDNELAGEYLKRDFDLTAEILKQMKSSSKRVGYARRFFDTFNSIHKLAGDADIEMLRGFVSTVMPVDDMRGVSLLLLSGMSEWKDQWGAEEYSRYVKARIDKMAELIPEARQLYEKDEQHRDFYAGLVLEERSVLDIKTQVYLGNWDDYCADLEKRLSGNIKDVELRIFSEGQIVKTLMEYEHKHSVDLSKYMG